MSHLQLDGRSIEYRTIPGAADRAWLVFLHEGLGSVSLWRDFPDKVARRTGRRALVYSRFGYGQSAGIDLPRPTAFMHHEARDVLPRILAALSIEQPILIGHSDGASIALIHAADARPAPPPALVLMAPHVFVEPLSVESIARIAETYASSDLKQRLARHHANVDDAFLGWSGVWLSREFRDWSLLPEVRRLTMPTLVIQGEADEYGTMAQVDAIASGAPGPVETLKLANAGHSPHRDQEHRVIDAIAAFVANRG